MAYVLKRNREEASFKWKFLEQFVNIRQGLKEATALTQTEQLFIFLSTLSQKIKNKHFLSSVSRNFTFKSHKPEF